MATKNASTKSPDPQSIAAETVKVVEEMVGKAQEQYLTALSEGQNVALETYKSVTGTVSQTMAETMSKLNLPSVPSLVEVPKIPATAFEAMFDFGAALVENQRTFTKKVLETTQS